MEKWEIAMHKFKCRNCSSNTGLPKFAHIQNTTWASSSELVTWSDCCFEDTQKKKKTKQNGIQLCDGRQHLSRFRIDFFSWQNYRPLAFSPRHQIYHCVTPSNKIFLCTALMWHARAILRSPRELVFKALLLSDRERAADFLLPCFLPEFLCGLPGFDIFNR